MSSPEEARKLVDWAIKSLGLKSPLTDEELDKEIDKMIAAEQEEEEEEEEEDWRSHRHSFARFMPIARRRFLYRADLGKVAQRLQQKLSKVP